LKYDSYLEFKKENPEYWWFFNLIILYEWKNEKFKKYLNNIKHL
jgi:hypothetical protein